MKRTFLFKNNLTLISPNNKIKFIIFLHLFNLSQINEWLSLINNFVQINLNSVVTLFINLPINSDINFTQEIILDEDYDIFDLQSCINDNTINYIKHIISLFKTCKIKPIFIVSKNKGVDIGGFFHFLQIIKDYQFDYVIKLHTKSDNSWRQRLSKILKKEYTKEFLSNIDLLSTMIFRYPSYKFDFETNNYHITKICHKYKIKYSSSFRFIPGTMFICSKRLITFLLELDLENIYNELNDKSTIDLNWKNIMNNDEIFNHHIKYNKINSESKNYINYGHNFNLLSLNITGIRDGMIEHAWERIFGLIAENLGGHIKQIYI